MLRAGSTISNPMSEPFSESVYVRGGEEREGEREIERERETERDIYRERGIY